MVPSLDTVVKLGTVATPIVVAVATMYVTRSINRIQVGPEFVNLALEIVEQDPSAQPEGLRTWALDVLDEYSGVDLDDGLRGRIEAGWGFADRTRLGSFSIRAGDPESQRIAGLELQVQFEAGTADGTLRQVTLTLPGDGGRVGPRDLREGEVLRISKEERVFLLQLEEVAGEVARFAVWEQSRRGILAE